MLFRRFFLVIYLLLVFHLIFVLSWRRRRRRRRSPPPSVNCQVSPWTEFSACSSKCGIGTSTRRRHITTHPAHGGSPCPSLEESRQCGSPNGGCQDVCNSADGSCLCVTRPGYELQDDGKSCGDINECKNGNGGCINSNCKNTDGSYWCDCLSGYKPSAVTPHKCEAKLCSPLIPPPCPLNAYHDEFGTACKPARISCPHGHEYLKFCSIDCDGNFKLAVIESTNIPNAFARNFLGINFNVPIERAQCILDSNTGNVAWDWDPIAVPYYCRRVNDPPSNILFSSTYINEKMNTFAIVGFFIANDFQNDPLTFTIMNEDANFYFLVQGRALLVNRRLVWKPRSDNIYTVKINVSDNGSPVMFTTTSFNITVLNVNDSPYDIRLSNNDVLENVNIGSVVGILTARDDDLGQKPTSRFTWELVDSGNGYFKLLDNKIVVAKSLDYEAKNKHRIKIKCTDRSHPPKSSSIQSLFVVVRDINELPKDIILTGNRIPENCVLGSVIGDFVATDDDNDTLKFYLNHSSVLVREKFALQGVPNIEYRTMNHKSTNFYSIPLVVNGSLDYEEENVYIIWLAVADPGRMALKQFRIEVTDVNEAPTDILMSENFVAENSPASTVIGKFLVIDPDVKSVPPQIHHCSLENSLNGDEDEFYITHETDRNFLRVKWNDYLDFEKKNVYNINVACKDAAGLDTSKSLKFSSLMLTKLQHLFTYQIRPFKKTLLT
ncbi:protocadherin Fat 4-like isoform X1 [Xenia sp. Carnegie-2017]|uniref:protocadherin Fat 4-like isoform X1 n=1 Tax=Xenia sp. Carnegie-2017 TaxID=2897299 RepID=UPI001F034CEE|nr:protocadherin Fat 4-like isoform X1 [Xenia sp. Carnegie-2017]